MSDKRQPRAMVVEPFDPEPSIETALSLLQAAGAAHALAGRLAVWAWVAADDQEFTKDVDFAVPEADMNAVAHEARARGYQLLPLAIGGFGIRTEDKRIDFIDRRVDFGALFAEAVEAARDQELATTTRSGRRLLVTPPEHLVAMKLATGDPHDERDVERLLRQEHFDYAGCRAVVRRHLGPAAANRLDHIGARAGLEAAARYVRESNGAPAPPGGPITRR
jgi:hypothetical protein